MLSHSEFDVEHVEQKEPDGFFTTFYVAFYYIFLMAPVAYGMYYVLNFSFPDTPFFEEALSNFFILILTSYAIAWVGCFVTFFVLPRLNSK